MLKKEISKILKLGDSRLYDVCSPVLKSELSEVNDWVYEMKGAMEDIRLRYGFGRAIAAPQLGIMKRLVYMNVDEPVIFINPEITYGSEEMIELWDDCMSFPNLLVKVRRHKAIILTFYDEYWTKQVWTLKDDYSELLQHECDHLDGILCTMRAIDPKSFKWRQ